MPCDPVTSWSTLGGLASTFSGACASPSAAFAAAEAPPPPTTWACEADMTPTLISVNPATGVQLTTVHVTLTGTNFDASAIVTPSDAGITVQNVVVVSATSITADFVISRSAAAATATVTVTTTDGVSNTVNFVVTAADQLAILRNITGWALMLDATSGMTISGANINALTDLSGNNVTVSMPDGVVPATSTLWQGVAPAWQLTTATHHRILIGGDASWVTHHKPYTIIYVVDGLDDNGAADGNVWRDNLFGAVGYINHAASKCWTLFAGTVFNSTFLQAARSGPNIRTDVINGAASAIWANGTKQTGDAGSATDSLGTFYIGSNSSNNAPVAAKMAFFGVVLSALSDVDIAAIIAILRARYANIPAI